MPWNGSGIFTRLYNFVADAASGIKILAAKQDAEWVNVVGGLNNTIARDGQNSPSHDINWGANKITNLAPGVAPTDAATVGQVSTTAGFGTAVFAWNQFSYPITPSVFSVLRIEHISTDTLGEWNTTTNRFTPANPGKYLVMGNWFFYGRFGSSPINAQVTIAVFKNGGSYVYVYVQNLDIADGKYFSCPYSMIVDLGVAGDYCDIRVYPGAAVVDGYDSTISVLRVA